MKNRIVLLVTVFVLSTYSFGHLAAQDYSVSLSGTFQLDKSVEEGFYEAFVFDGAGKVGIHAFGEYKGDFLQVGDTVVVYPDKSIFTFLLKDNKTLVGIDTWVKGQVFRKMENDTIIAPMQNHGAEYAAQSYEFYTLTGRKALDLSTYLSINIDPELNASMKRLCEEGFPRACLTMANALMMNSPALASLFRNSEGEEQKYPPNREIVDYYIQAVELGEQDGIAQLGAYFLLLGHVDEAKKVFEKGCEMGHSGCCLSLLNLELDDEEEEEVFEDE